MQLKLEIPDGMYCEKCNWLIKSDQRDGGGVRCKIFDCVLGNKLTNVFKCPMCIEQSRNQIVMRGDIA